MAPWSPPHENSHYVWVPEGSCFPPSYLKRYFRERHSPPDPGPPSTTLDVSRLLSVSRHSEHSKTPSRSLSIRPRSSNSAHFTRTPDITLAHTTTATVPSVHVRTKLRRWSINVPPSYLNTEILKRQLEFRHLDTTIGTYFAQSETWNETPLPSIKVSTSTATIAVSIPGSPETPTPEPEPEPLAIRRGKKMLSPLTLQTPKHADDDYPGIPTAFLGTPSAYSPHFQFPSLNARSETKSLAVGDMINTLRSQVADLRPSFPDEDCEPLLDEPAPSKNSLPAESSDVMQNISEDEWAFAHELMSRYSGHSQSKTPNKEKRSRRQAATTRKSLTPESRLPTVIQNSRARRASVPPAVSTPKNRPKSSSAPRTDLIKPGNSSTTTRQGKASRLTTPIVGNRSLRHLTRPVSSPGLSFGLGSSTSDSLDTSPSSSKSEYPPKRPLGILKHVKSVRFAEMPTKDDAEDNTPLTGQPRAGTTKGNGTPSSLHPSPLRANFVPGELDTPTPLKSSQATPVSEEPSRYTTASRRNSVQKTSVPSATSRMPVFNTPTQAPTYPVVTVASDKAKLSINSQLAARTFSLLAKEHDNDRENIPLALRTRRRMRRYTQVDENAARRASSGEVGSRKHRLSSPLKSFLERLRA
jgi:hypothetical protein